ncbi:hypothetical protein F5882DRAFT_401458 [Hyaloscypha sp. PMI_1271]|nr:hypothetical protein F5882DRAFT_401458 [Hyaloscypha sp. PMI_1271]
MAPYLSPREIAAIDAIVIVTKFNTTYETIRYRRYQIRVRTALGWDPRKKPGRLSIIIPEMEEAVMEYVLRYVDTIVSRLLKRLDITYKRIKAVAAEQNQELLEVDQIIIVDELAFNEYMGHRKYGWILLKRGLKWSLLPVYTINGYLEPLVY